jgi:hypothetical protein
MPPITVENIQTNQKKTKQFSVAKILFKFGNVAASLKREIGSVYLVFNMKNKLNF